MVRGAIHKNLVAQSRMETGTMKVIPMDGILVVRKRMDGGAIVPAVAESMVAALIIMPAKATQL